MGVLPDISSPTTEILYNSIIAILTDVSISSEPEIFIMNVEHKPSPTSVLKTGLRNSDAYRRK